MRGRGDLARADPQQIGALDGEWAPRGVDPEHILEIVEADLAADGVVGAAQETCRQHLGGLERRRLLVLSGLRRADEDSRGEDKGECDRRGATRRKPMQRAQLNDPPPGPLRPWAGLYRQIGGSRKGPKMRLFAPGEIDEVTP